MDYKPNFNLGVFYMYGLTVLKNDLAFGIPLETTVISKLAFHFDEPITKETAQYSKWDASSSTTKYEIKSRRNKYKQYPTTIIPVDKTQVTGRLVFVFNFTDGLYYIVYDKEPFSQYEIKDIPAFRAGGKQTLKPHYMIPIEDLTEIKI